MACMGKESKKRVDIDIYVYIYTYTYIYIYTHTHICIDITVYIYIYIHTHICIDITDLFCCTTKTNTALWVNYTPIRQRKQDQIINIR